MSSAELIVYRGCTPVIDAQYEPNSDHSPSEAIIDAVATAADVDPMDLPPLYDYVDPDALDKLFDQHDRAEDAETFLGFRIDIWNVFIRADGWIRVCDRTRPTEPTPVFDPSPS